MPGLTASLHTAGRMRALGLTILALVAISVWAPSAYASGCTNSWASAKSGSWFEKENWSKKTVPVAGEEVCITVAGTYSVTLTQTGGAVSLKALTLGGASGAQALIVGSSSSAHADFETTAGIAVEAHGSLTLTNGDAAGNNVTVEGPITNSGTITSEPAHGGARTLFGSLTNKGSLAINTNTSFNGSKAALQNEGAITIAAGTALTASNSSAVTNAAGGSIAGGATGTVFMAGGTSFTEGAGTTSGTQPVIVDDAALTYSGSGASLIRARGGSTLSGNISSAQTLSIESTGSENAETKAGASFTNGGSIVLTNGDAAANYADLFITAGTLTNSGTITSEPAHGGARYLEGNVTNTGTLAFNATTKYDIKSTLTNEGSIKLAEGVQLTVSASSSVINGAGGSIAGGATGNVFMAGGTSFTEGAGTTSGTQPVIVDDAALIYTGSGASLIRARGGSTLSGNISSGQTLSIESTSGENAQTTAAASFTNAGSIVLTNGDAAGNWAALTISAGTLTNSGTITSEPASGGSRYLEGNVTNAPTGTLAINATTKYDLKALLTNEGAVKIAKGVQLTVSGAASVTNAGGSITGTENGDLFQTGGTFTEGAGATSGTQPVIVDDAALSYTGSGSSLIRARGSSTLSGNLSAGQTLSIESTSSENSQTTASASFTNAGSIVLTNGDAAANWAALTVSAGTLTNSGTISSEAGVGGARYLQGNVTNASTGTLAFNATTKYDVKATLINEGAIKLATGVALLSPSSNTISNEAGGSIAAAGTGAIAETGGTFNEGAGTTSGSLPVILDDLALHYTGKGASTIALRGASTLSGTINAGQVLSIQSSCSEHATVTAPASFTNSGTIALANGDACANNAVIVLPAKATLTNKSTGTINVEGPNGGVRELEGSLKDEGLLSVSAGETFKVTGTYTQTGAGTLKTAISGSSTFGALAVTGAAKVAGALAVTQVEPFVGKAGEAFAILSSSARTGTFTDLDNVTTTTSGLYYLPSYTSTGVTVTVKQAVLTATPTEGPAGSTVTLKGTGFPPSDKIKPTFVDFKKAKTTFATVTTNPSGEFSIEVKLSSKAAKGAGTFSATSTLVTGLVVIAPFTVT